MKGASNHGRAEKPRAREKRVVRRKARASRNKVKDWAPVRSTTPGTMRTGGNSRIIRQTRRTGAAPAGAGQAAIPGRLTTAADLKSLRTDPARPQSSIPSADPASAADFRSAAATAARILSRRGPLPTGSAEAVQQRRETERTNSAAAGFLGRRRSESVADHRRTGGSSGRRQAERTVRR